MNSVPHHPMNIIETASPFMSPHDGGILLSRSTRSKYSKNTSPIETMPERISNNEEANDTNRTYQRPEKHTYSDLAIDPFISQYIKSPRHKPPFNYHSVFFESVKDDLNNHLFELYQKYLIRRDSNHDTKPDIKVSGKDLTFPRTYSDPEKICNLISKGPVVLKKPLDKPSTPKSEFITLPRNFMDCELNDLMELISRLLDSLIVLNDKHVHPSISNPQKGSKATNQILTRYHSRTPPAISAHTYLSRLTRFNNLNPGTLLTTIYYIDLLSHHYQPYFTLNSWTVHRFLLVATMLSQKLLEDFFYTNEHYAKVGGVAVTELNCLELDFLERVDWRCVPGKAGDDNVFSIKFAKTTLDLYYSQLVSLMGKPSHKSSVTTYRFKDEEFDCQFLEDESNDDIFDEDGEEKVMDDELSEPTGQGTWPVYDDLGYSIDGSSSPHLKRRFPSNFGS